MCTNAFHNETNSRTMNSAAKGGFSLAALRGVGILVHIFRFWF